MKRIKALFIPILFGMLLSSCTPSGGGSQGGGGGGEVVKDPELNVTEKTIKVDDEFDLTISNVPEGVVPTWSQQGTAITFQLTSIIKADSAKVKGVSAGQATITIMVGEKTLTCRVTVENKVEPKKYATITIEANQYMTTTLQAGSNYELNQPINFTVSSINEEYSVTSVKMNDTELSPANNSNNYSFTPTEEKEYKLKVTTEELKNVVVYEFKDLTKDDYDAKLTKKGTRLYINNDGVDFENLIKNGNLNLANTQKILFLHNDDILSNPRVMINKITFTFVSGKDNLAATNLTEHEEYSNGVYRYTLDEYNEDTANLMFNATGDVVISKVVVNTTPYVEYKINLKFNGIGEGEKVYYLNGATFEEWEKRKEVTADTGFVQLQTYYLYVEWNQYHKTFCSDLNMSFKETPLRVNMFYPSDESGLPKDSIVCYEFHPQKAADKTNTIDFVWAPKEAKDSIKVDVTSANKYVRRFMETDPLVSLGLANLHYGAEAKIDLMPKRGYMNLKIVVNDQVITRDQETDVYKFKVPFTNPINISFTAEEGNEDRQGKDIIALKGDDADKGVIIGSLKDDQLYLMFDHNEDHPTAELTALSYRDVALERKINPGEEGEADKYYYVLSKEQTTDYKAAADKSSLFTATVTESGSYKSMVSFNSGAFKVEVTGKEPNDENQYEFDGKSSVTFKVTPNDYLDIHSIEVNDKRLTSEQYTFNPEDGSITYTFTANALKNDVLIQTKSQTVQLELDREGSTQGYRIKDLPTTPSICGQAITLTLETIDDSTYWLFGKKITVTYNGQELPVDENNFTFTIIPVKGVSKIKVVVEDKPQ